MNCRGWFAPKSQTCRLCGGAKSAHQVAHRDDDAKRDEPLRCRCGGVKTHHLAERCDACEARRLRVREERRFATDGC